MAYLISSKTVTSAKATVQFDLIPNYTNYVVGISFWLLSFGEKTDHHIQDISVKLLSIPTRNQLTTSVVLVLSDDSGHQIDGAASQVDVVCISTDNLNDFFANVEGASNIKSPSISFSNIQNNVQMYPPIPFVSGFSAAFAKGDHELLEFAGQLGYLKTGNRGGDITANVILKDSSGNSDPGASLDAGVIAVAQSTPDPQLYDFAASNVQFSGTLSVGQAQQAVALIQGFAIQFEKTNHNVKTISAGAAAPLVIVNGEVNLSDCGAAVEDNSGHSQDNTLSYVNLVVFAL